MKDFTIEFIEFAIAKGALKFGEFTLKSGRRSPYFFNAGTFDCGNDLALLGKFYSAAIIDAELEFDLLFGPAYKGIPLATATALCLARDHQINKPYCFNRKEAKTHGEGGSIVGAALSGRCLIIDDVITAGTAIRESINMIEKSAEVSGAIVALDRQEKGLDDLSAIQEIEKSYNIPVVSIANLDSLIDYLSHTESLRQHLDAVAAYRQQYGI